MNNERNLKVREQLETLQKSDSTSRNSFFLPRTIPLFQALTTAIEKVRNQDKNEKITRIMEQIIEGHYPKYITNPSIEMDVSKETISQTIQDALELSYALDKPMFELILKTPHAVQDIIFRQTANVLRHMRKESDKTVVSTYFHMPDGSLTGMPIAAYKLFQNLQTAIAANSSDQEKLSSEL